MSQNILVFEQATSFDPFKSGRHNKSEFRFC